jgi:hypothetical protein
MDGEDRVRRTRSRSPRLRAGAACLGAAALVLAGCGGTAPDAVELEPPEEDVQEQPEPEEEPDAPNDADDGVDADDVATGADGEDPADDPVGDAEEDAVVLRCDLAVTEGGTTVADAAYERAVLEANLELEMLAMELAADLDELLSGISDGPTLEAQLLDHQQRYVEITSLVADLQPPGGADRWHEQAMGSFDAVCAAIADGLAGSSQGEEDRFDAFVQALTGFPSVLNQLHANAACGPFESC